MGEWFQDYGHIVGPVVAVLLGGLLALGANALERKQGASVEQNHWLRREQLAAASQLTPICQRMTLGVDTNAADHERSLQSLLAQSEVPVVEEAPSADVVLWEEGWIAAERLALVADDELYQAGRRMFTVAARVSYIKKAGMDDELDEAQQDFADRLSAFRESALAEFRPKRKSVRKRVVGPKVHSDD